MFKVFEGCSSSTPAYTISVFHNYFLIVLFPQRDLLFGLQSARAAIVEQEKAIIVEGYLDVVR